MSLLAIFNNTHFRITVPVKGCSSFIYNKAWRHESESLKIMNLDADVFLISSRALKIAQISWFAIADSVQTFCFNTGRI